VELEKSDISHLIIELSNWCGEKRNGY